MAWSNWIGSGQSEGNASCLCRFSQPSGAVRTTSSYVASIPLRVWIVTCGDLVSLSRCGLKNTTSSLRCILALASAGAAISSRMFL
jgi:hypothetical protein